ncbi:MAG: hypothetical protein ACI8QC_004301 [Planctomycetota bacterium]|jgi:uncharacterized protein YndB with AHSA1/START domain
MTSIAAERVFKVSPESVFTAISDVPGLPNTNPEIVEVEILSTQTSGVGTRFRELRRMGKRELVTELELTEWDPPRSVRMLADTHGTVWDTLFTVSPVEGGTLLKLDMDARAHALLPRLLNPLMKGLFRKGLVKHLDALESYFAG